MTSKENLIWLAGLIDGEGCIHSHMTGKNNPSIQVQVHCASKIMVDSIEEIYLKEGIEYFRDLPFRQPKSTKDTHRITVRKKASIIKILRLIVIFMKVKSQEADLAIDYINKYPNRSITATLEEKESFVSKLRQLKRI